MSRSEPTNLSERLFLALLRLHPRSYRDHHLRPMLDVFRQLRVEARRSGRLTRIALTARELMALGVSALRLMYREMILRKSARGGVLRRAFEMFMTVLQDIRFAARSLRRSPGFASVVILTLGLGIGATTAIFSVVNGVLLRPLEYRSPEKLVFIWDGLDWIGVPRAWVNPREVADLRERTTVFESIAAIDPSTSQITGDGAPELIQTGLATGNLFELLGVSSLHGRLLQPADDVPGASGVAVLDHGFWSLRYGADPGVVGSTVVLDGNPVTVIGVLPPTFHFKIHSSLGDPQRADVWLPLQLDLASQQRGSHFLAVLARVRDDATMGQAMAELDGVSEAYDEEIYGGDGFAFKPAPVLDDLVKDARPVLLVLFGAVMFVLLIGTTNIATVMLARAQDRGREFAVRGALGGSRGRLIRQLVTESVFMSVVGGALGFAVASATLDTLIGLAPEGLARVDEIGVDARVFLFALAISLAIGVLCGLAPALGSATHPFADALRDGGRGSTSGYGARHARSGLVAVEFALSMMLLIGTGLMVRSFMTLQRVDPGFRSDGVLTLRIPLSGEAYTDFGPRVVFYRSLLDRVRGLPGVSQAGATTALPLTASANQNPVFRTSSAEFDPDDPTRLTVDTFVSTPGYLRAASIPLLAGRDFGVEDRSDTAPVAIVDELVASQYWPDGDAIGQNIQVRGRVWEVIGVARHARQYEIHRDDRPQVYTPHAQAPFRALSLAVRSSTDPAELARAVRGAVAEFDPNQAVSSVQTLSRIVGDSLAQRRFAMFAMIGFGCGAMLLAAIGLYGVTAHVVGQRTQEIGVRMALGARRATVMGMVFTQAGAVVTVGLLMGVVGALALSRFISGMLYGVSPRDPATMVFVSLTLVAVACVATFVPALRATRVDPMAAIRSD